MFVRGVCAILADEQRKVPMANVIDRQYNAEGESDLALTPVSKLLYIFTLLGVDKYADIWYNKFKQNKNQGGRLKWVKFKKTGNRD